MQTILFILLYLSIGTLAMCIYGIITESPFPYTEGEKEKDSAMQIAMLFFYPIVFIVWFCLTLYKTFLYFVKTLKNDKERITGKRDI